MIKYNLNAPPGGYARQPSEGSASPRQLARLRYLGVPFAEPLTRGGAGALIDATKDHPDFVVRVRQWHKQKYRLHPDLYPASERFEAQFADDPEKISTANIGSWLRHLLPVAAALIAGFLIASGPGKMFGPPGSVQTGTPTPPAVREPLAKRAEANSPKPFSAQFATTVPAKNSADTLLAEDLLLRVAESKRSALAKYPDLAKSTSEINIRYNYRYSLMAKDHSPRLQDPDWPLTLADECAAASGIAVSPATPASVAGFTGRMATPTSSSVLASTTTVRPLHAVTTAYKPAATHVQPIPAQALPATVNQPKSTNALPFVRMDAGSTGNGNDYTYNWISGWGSYDMSFRQSVGLHVGLRNMSRGPVELNLRWVFFARRTQNNERYVFAAETKPVDLESGQTASFPIDSPMIESRDQKYVLLGEQYLEGAKYEGWLVQVADKRTGRVIKQAGSTSYLEDLANRNDYTALIADYSKSVKATSSALANR